MMIELLKNPRYRRTTMSAKKTTALAVLLVVSVVAYILACSQATWSPDGKRIAFVSQESETAWSLLVWDTEAGTARELVKSSTAMGPPAWSPDGKQLAVVNFIELKAPQGGEAGHAYRLYLVNPTDGTPRLLGETNLPAGSPSDNGGLEPYPQWTEGGKMIAWPIRPTLQVRLVDAESGRMVKTIDNAIAPVISPSRKLMVMLEKTDDKGAAVAILDLEKMERRTILRMPTVAFRVQPTEVLAWSPDSSQLLIAGQPMTKAENAQPGAEQWVKTGDTCSLWTVAVSDGKAVPLGKELPGEISSLDWALKGDRIAMTMSVKVQAQAKDSGSEIGVWLMKADGSDLRRIDHARGDDLACLPVFSPDGSRLSYRFQRNKGTGMALIYDLATGTEKTFYSQAEHELPEFNPPATSATSAASATPATSAVPAK
jgi:Tol biopolymer transport system component